MPFPDRSSRVSVRSGGWRIIENGPGPRFDDGSPFPVPRDRSSAIVPLDLNTDPDGDYDADHDSVLGVDAAVDGAVDRNAAVDEWAVVTDPNGSGPDILEDRVER